MKLNFAFRKGLKVLFAAGLFLFLCFAGPSALVAQAETYTTNISPGKQFGDNPPTFDSTRKQRESGSKIGKVERKSDAPPTVSGDRMKDVGKVKRK